MTLLEKAIVFATQKHAGQKRRWGGEYILHPLAVCHMLAAAGYDETYQVVAVLHDVLEDTQTTKEELTEFGEKVVHAVDLLTRREGQSEEEYVSGILTDNIAAVVKSADKIHNLWDAVYCAPYESERTDEQKAFARAYIKKTKRFYERKFCSALTNAIYAAEDVLSYTPVPNWRLFMKNGTAFKLYSEIAQENYEEAKKLHDEQPEKPDLDREDAIFIYEWDRGNLLVTYGSVLFANEKWILCARGWGKTNYDLYGTDFEELTYDQLKEKIEEKKAQDYFYDFVTDKDLFRD
ncbi:MAG: bifunctional (p)ppGpp synthetase/guanosine-3',5'-bis(diphosphate) 3'-pyrophosphohydrolase [Clostridia bacterium]|nr:bifunctional (p)ppGpp synthetase/guanosine-3',5'-bis(diphosphate) 3'-pyrophosphohydrolase [Clostridia bacterium]